MNQLLQPIFEITVIFPAAVLCFLPVKDWLRIRIKKLFLLTVIVLTAWCILGGILCYTLHIPTNMILIPSLFLWAILYRHTLELPVWKSINVFLGVCGVFSCLSGPVTVADAFLSPKNQTIYFCLEASIFHNLLSWTIVGILWYPASHAARELLKEKEPAQTWFVFWILPITFIVLNLFIAPKNTQELRAGRMTVIYPLITMTFFGLLLLFYLLFYLLARSFNHNTRLQQENQFLHMMRVQYKALQESITETQQMRHDMRHHFHVLSALAERKEWEKLKHYLATAGNAISSGTLSLCANPAVDGVAGYYAVQYQKNGIPFSFHLDLPEELPLLEIDLCVTLSNLLENALDASLLLDKKSRTVSVRSQIHGEQIVLLWVENNYTGTITEDAGIFHSSKHNGSGMGLQSVQRIAEKNGGYCKFEYDGHKFCAFVMLRNEQKY